MWFQILKNDLKKRKSVNLILLVFVILSTMFLASSANNINMMVNGLDYYVEAANVSDLFLILYESDKQKVEDWLNSREEVTDYTYEELCEIPSKDLGFGDEGLLLFLSKSGGKYSKALDVNGNDLELQNGQVAVSVGVMKQQGLQEGEQLEVRMQGQTYSYTIVPCKDILLGNTNFGLNRLLFTERDYNAMVTGSDNIREVAFFLNSDDLKETAKSMDDQIFPGIINAFSKNSISILYVFDMILAGLCAVVSLCLIIISLLILRFSIVFTLEENYQEIGIMKAIGMRNKAIQKIYLFKYLVIVTIGATIGFVGSIPVGNFMTKSISQTMVLGDAASAWGINLLCCLFVVIFVTGMSLLFTGKMKHVSAVTAMRCGEKGERYEKRRGLYLYKRKRMGTIPFLALNDVLCNKTRYFILVITFCVSFILISIPVNTTTTMESAEMVKKFCVDTKSAIYIDSTMIGGRDQSALQQEMDAVKADLKKIGYDAKISSSGYYYLKWKHNEDSVKLVSAYPMGDDSSYLVCDEGETPVLSNEVAFSKKIMEEYDLSIGDVVTTTICGEEKEFIITGYYTDYFQQGKGARFSPNAELSKEVMIYHWVFMINMETDMEQDLLKETLMEQLPQYAWMTTDELISGQVGSIKDTMAGMQLPMTLFLCALIMLVSIFMMKLFIVREKGQMAMLKSIGFTNRSVRLWLIMRMIWVVVISMVIAVPLSILSNRYILAPIFGIMGAEVQIQVEPLKAYIIYPGVLLIGIMIATIWATGSVLKITTKDMVNVE